MLVFLLGALLASPPVRIAPSQPGTSFRQPQLAVTGDRVAVAFGSGNAVFFAASHDGGETFARPVKVAEEGVLALGRHRGPRIAIAGDGIVVSAVVGSKGGGADGDLLAWRSTDGGATWSLGRKINDVPGAAREGLHAMASDGQKLVFAVWLDARKKGTRLFGATSHDGGISWSRNRLVYESPDGHICECCHPSAAIDSGGRIYVMWRNWLGGSRNLYLARSTDSGESFSGVEKLGKGTWPLNACPMDGGGIALGPSGPVTVWRREKAIYVARPGAAETGIGDGKDPAIALGPSGPYVAWTQGSGLKTLAPGGAETQLAEQGSYVQLAGTSPVLAVWEDTDGIFVARLP